MSATISDSSGQAWLNGTYSFVFKVSPSQPTGVYRWNGGNFSTTQTIAGSLDGSGHFSVSIPSNTSITPAGSTWVLTVCPVANGNIQCFTTQGLTITGATQNLTSVVIPPAISIDLAHPAYPFTLAYKHQEITTAPLGGLYYDLVLQHYFICETLSLFSCTNWVEICQFGDTTCVGAGGSESFQHNGTLVGTQPTFNIIDSGTVTATMTNDTLNNRVNVSFTASGGGTGCTLPSINTAVLSEHPAGTCYDSLHWTWNDGTGKQLYQVGNGTNTLSANASLAFLQGGNITVTGDTAGNITGLMDFGGSSIITQTNAGSLISDAVHIGGTPTGTAQNRITSTAGGYVLDVMCLMQGCTDNGLTHRGIVATGAGGTQDTNINEVFSAGVSNMATAASLSNTSSIFFLAENSTATSANGCNNSDNFFIGEFSSTACASASAANLNSSIILGFNHTLSASAHQFSNIFLLGDTLTATQSDGSNHNDVGLFGKNLTANNCSDYWAIGENSTSCASNKINIGLSSTPEIQITPGSVNITGTTTINGTTLGGGSFTGPNGYATLPGGLILQWARGTAVTTDNTQTVTFPIAFPTSCLSVVTTNLNVSGTNVTKDWGVLSFNTTGVSVQLQRRGDEGSFTAQPIIWAVGF